MNNNRNIMLPAVMGDFKERQEVLKEIKNNPITYDIFKELREESQEEFIEFCMGVRGMKMTYDTFFKHIFDAEVHPERLAAFLSEIIGRPLKIMRELRKEGRRISDEASLVILDLIVEFDTGEVADVEIQKYGYLFPGERASCYASDMMMRQYEREKNIRGDKFNYKDLKKVYTIVIMENSSKEFKKFPNTYIHRGEWKFDTNLKLNLLQEFYFIPLDIFLRLEDNTCKETIGKELDAWLYFIGSDKPEHICKVIQSYPKFEELYRDIGYFRYHPEEAIGMFSDALRIMDENTVKYMIDEQAQKIKEQADMIAEQDDMITKQADAIAERDKKIEEQDNQIREQGYRIEKQNNRIKEQSNQIKEQGNRIEEQDNQIREQGYRIKKQNNRMEEQSNQLKEQGNRIEKYDNRIREQGNQIEDLSLQIEEMKKVLSSI